MNCIGVNYKKVPLSIREHYAFSEEEQRQFHQMLKEKYHCAGSVIVSTCNRSEIYFCGESEDIVRALAEYKGLQKGDILEHIYVYTGERALHHLFHVASGLDSMVLGEDEILRQVKDGYQLALEQGSTCNEINIAFQGAFGSAKDIKTNTLLSKTPVSMGTLAANEIESFLREYGGSSILLVGITGKIGSILAKNLCSKGITNIVGTTRKHTGVLSTFSDTGIRMVDFAERYSYVDEADVVISATTGPHYTFLAKRVAEVAVNDKPRLFIDMAVPRDMDEEIAGLSGVTFLDIDDFERMAAHNNEVKLRETDKAELILEEKIEETTKSIYMSAFMEQDRSVFEALKGRSFGSVFYQLKEELTGEQLKILMEAMERLVE